MPGIKNANTLRLTIKGQALTVVINGKPPATLQAQFLPAPSLIGLYRESGAKVDTWKSNNFKVTTVK